MLGFIFSLLGFVRSAAQTVLDLFRRYPLQVMLFCSVAACLWLYAGKQNALDDLAAERAARSADWETFKQAQRDAAIRAQAALNESATDFEQTRADNLTQTIRDRETLKVIYRDIQVPADCALPASAASLLDQARVRANGYASGEPSKPVSADQAAN